MEYKSLNNLDNLARISAGFKGGPFFKNVNRPPSITFVDAVDAGVKEVMWAGKIPQPAVIDVWNERRK